MHTVRGDGVAGIKQRHCDLSGDGVRNLVTTSGRDRLKKDLESSTWRRETTLVIPTAFKESRLACHAIFLLNSSTKPTGQLRTATWTLRKLEQTGSCKINELDEMRLDAYESSISYKERTKRWHDKWIKTPINYGKGDKILIFNSRLRLFSENLKSRWYGPFSVSKELKNGKIKLYDEDRNEFIVNTQQVKPYQKDVLETDKQDDITLDDEGEVTFHAAISYRLYLTRRSLKVLRKFPLDDSWRTI
ncbi:hypothetical protein Tco_0649956 [Tanacetum coccineum]